MSRKPFSRSNTEFAKGVAWLEPFYRSAEDLLPRTKRLQRVVGYTAALSSNSLAQCSTGNNRNFIISIGAWYWLDKKRHKKRPIIAQHMLEDFAHELAHICEWNHTPRHVDYTARILRRFAKTAKKMNLKNLEVRRCKKLGKLY